MRIKFYKTNRFSLLLSVVVLLLATVAAFGQNDLRKADWRKKSNFKDASFYEIQKSFNDFWTQRPKGKGQGRGVFQRWANYAAPRVYPSGDLSLLQQTYPNYIAWYKKQHGSGLLEARSFSSPTGNWTEFGPLTKPSGYDGGVGRIDVIRFDPTNKNCIYVGSPDGGLWKTIDGGMNWTTNTDFLPVIGVSDLVIDPTNTQILYLATGNWEYDKNSIGILKSTNGGASWSATGLVFAIPDFMHIRRLIMDPTNPLIMIAVGDFGVSRTTDGWATFSTPLMGGNFFDADFNPGNHSTVFAMGTQFFKSVDNGVSWNEIGIADGIPDPVDVSRGIMAVSLSDTNFVYSLYGGTDNGYLGIYLSTDAGNTFTLQSSSPNILSGDLPPSPGGQATHDMGLAVSPTDKMEVHIGGINQYKSIDAGVTWTLSSYWLGEDPMNPGGIPMTADYVHADIQDIQFKPGSSDTIYTSCDGGISISPDQGGSWKDISNNLRVAQMTNVAMSATNASYVVTGLQDIGTLLGNGGSFSVINGGDGESAVIDYTNDMNIISSNPNGNHDLSKDGGVTRDPINGNGLPVGTLFYSHVLQDPVDNNKVYACGRAALYVSTDVFTAAVGFHTWNALGTPPGTGSIIRIVVAPSNTMVIYAIKEDKVSRSDDGGSTWMDFSAGLPVGTVEPTNIAVSDTDPLKAWVTFSGYSPGDKVYRTVDGGTTWTPISAGLPNLPINTIVYTNGSSTDAIYIGADIGVYYYDNVLAAWSPFMTQLPNTHVTDLKIFYPTGKLRAATYGRGLWESDLFGNALKRDTISVVVLGGSTTTVCFDSVLQNLPTQPFRTSFCSDTMSNLLTAESLTDSCVTFTAPMVMATSMDSLCIVSCYAVSMDTIYDTTFIRVTIQASAMVTITCPRDTLINCGTDTSAASLGTPTGMSTCAMPVIVYTKIDTIIAVPNACADKFMIKRTWKATDNCGSMAICVQMINVQDTTRPIVMCPRDTTINCGTDTSTFATGMALITDNCTTPVVNIIRTDVLQPGDCPHQYTITRTWIAIDSCNNTNTCTQTIMVQDTTKPMISCPRDTTVTFGTPTDAMTLGMATATDNCTKVVTNISMIDATIPGVCEESSTIRRKWIAVDSCFNIDSCIQIITVVPQGAPTIMCPRDTMVMCAGDTSAANLGFAFDPMTMQQVTITRMDTIINKTCKNKFTILRKWKATDICGAMAMCTQTIIVNDTIAPTFMFPNNIDTVECGMFFDIVFPGAPAMDNCDGPIMIQSNISIIDSTCPGNLKILIVYSASDSCGNTTTHRDTIVRVDRVAPVLECPEMADTTDVECGMLPALYANLDSFLVHDGYADDDCCLDSSSFTCTEVVSFSGTHTIYTRTYRIQDCCGLSDSCQLVYRTPTCALDLALKKVINGPVPFAAMPGGNVPFKVTVYNQFMVPADSIKIIDYLPSMGSSVTTAGWINNGNGTSCLTLSRANGLLPPSGLLFGDSVVVTFNVLLGLDASPNGSNSAEIVSAQDTAHHTLGDSDSSPDAIPGNETGTIDDATTNPADEDDQDIAAFFICQELVCSDKVNVSLDNNCSHCFSAKDLLKGSVLPDAFYNIEISDAAGKKLPSNCVGRESLGYHLIFKVVSKAPCPINSCWGEIIVEDKYPPVLNCGPDTVTCFEYGQLPKGNYTVADNCGDSVKVVIVSEVFTDYGCADPNIMQKVLTPPFQGKVTRQLVASDQWGNSVTCTKEYFIMQLTLDSVVCPRDTVVNCALAVLNGKSILDVMRSGAPYAKTSKGNKSLFSNNSSCKITVTYSDKRYELCGQSYKVERHWIITDWCTGLEKKCTQWISILDTTAPVATNKVLTAVASSPHDCGQYVNLDTLVVSDCNWVTQTYTLKINEEGTVRVLSGKLPASRVWLPVGNHTIEVDLADACNNRSKGSISITVYDASPPTPICLEYTQVTIDPTSCWASVAAKDLNTGSKDNCCNVLHYAVAHMDSITYWRNYWNTTLEAEVGKASYWNKKPIYDSIIEEWINCYVFADSVNFDDCGNSQVVMRVYEACGVPRYDPHIFPCSPHAWFCYNTYAYKADFNFNWFDAAGPKSCKYRPALTSIAKLDARYSGYYSKGYFNPMFAGSAQYEYCQVPYYFPGLIEIHKNLHNVNGAPGSYCSRRLYNDCMVNVLVDDKQAPVVAGLADITIYCDGAPDYAGSPDCGKRGDSYGPSTWPGQLKDFKGVIHGYYGGSAYLGIHVAADEHEDPQACLGNRGWAPIYCKSWLYLDSFDQAGHVDPKLYFDKLVLFDKTRSTRTLKPEEFSITDNCRLDDATLTVVDNGTLNGCSEGWIQRTWTIKDKCGNAVTATQKIIVKHRSDFEVIFPEDKIVTCDFINKTDTSKAGAGSPIISDDECEQVGLRYSDEIFTVESDACYKIVRTWTLIDWCIYNPNQHDHDADVIVNDSLRANKTDRSCVYRNIKDNNDGYMTYVQIIKVIDEIAPVVTCEDETICIDAGCSTPVNIPLKGTDNCADAVIFRVDITRPDGSHDIRSDITAITGIFTEGLYKIRIIGKDRCGNEDTCNMNLTIRDCKAPTPYCLNGVATVVMPSVGTIEIWAKDLDKNSEDNCTAKDKLKFSFSKLTSNASRVLSCTDILNGREQAIELEVWVTDASGNHDFCKTYILLQDNGGLAGGTCKDTTLNLASISGKLQTENNDGVEAATVEISSNSNYLPSWKSGIDGSYRFQSLPLGGKYTINARRDDQPMNGISTLDLVLIQKHILGTERFTSPYKVIAADVDNSNDVSVFDLVELRKLILGLYDKLPQSTSWKFVPKSHVFSDIQNPWGYAVDEKVDAMTGDVVKDFVGIKIGDVNGTASAHSLMRTEIRGSGSGLVFDLEDKVYQAGERVEVKFKSNNFKGITGFQGTLNVQGLVSDIELKQGDKLKMTNNNIGTRWAQDGFITMSWNTNTSTDLSDEDVLFTMAFTAKSAGRLSQSMRITSQHTIAESYEGKGQMGGLSLRFVNKNGTEVASKSELFQNFPNPFDQRTVIGIYLAESTRGTLKITDITGRTIKVISQEWAKGYNEIWIDKQDLPASGVLYYSFESGAFNAVKKMVLLD